jgi:dihydrofolate reductase
MNAIPKVVFSRSGSLAHEPTTALRNATKAQLDAGLPLLEQPADWGDTRILSGDLGAEIADLKTESENDLFAHGGASFAQSLVRLGLVDEYRILVHPTVLGSGMALFDGATPSDLKLATSTTFANGVHTLVYNPI